MNCPFSNFRDMVARTSDVQLKYLDIAFCGMLFYQSISGRSCAPNSRKSVIKSAITSKITYPEKLDISFEFTNVLFACRRNFSRTYKILLIYAVRNLSPPGARIVVTQGKK